MIAQRSSNQFHKQSLRTSQLAVWAVRIWGLSCLLYINLSLQNSHTCGSSPVCVRRWFLRMVWVENDSPHRVHLYGRSPVCPLRWVLSWNFCANFLSQNSQLYGFSLSPVWIRTWFRQVVFLENALSQKAQTNFLLLGSISFFCGTGEGSWSKSVPCINSLLLFLVAGPAVLCFTSYCPFRLTGNFCITSNIFLPNTLYLKNVSWFVALKLTENRTDIYLPSCFVFKYETTMDINFDSFRWMNVGNGT